MARRQGMQSVNQKSSRTSLPLLCFASSKTLPWTSYRAKFSTRLPTRTQEGTTVRLPGGPPWTDPAPPGTSSAPADGGATVGAAEGAEEGTRPAPGLGSLDIG